MEKKFVILEQLIREYIDNPEPISSKLLQEKLYLGLSSATIRYYFKQLTENGYLQKEHISSGRIPTKRSLKQFWRKNLKENEIVIKQIDLLEEASKSQSIFCEYSLYKNLILTHIENLNNKFLILGFDTKELIVPYNAKVAALLQNFVGVQAFDIARMLYDYDMVNLANRIKEFLKDEFKICNIDEIVDMANDDKRWANSYLIYVLSGKNLIQEPIGLRFYDNFLSYKFYVSINNEKKGEVLLVGKLHRNYLKFMQNLKGVDNGEKRAS
ncbi:hypothetical protein [Nitratiruptor sp. YY09-18]|uniref:hypothetical protein n=1 Tax=Nitratiruptor sp. YY09-18 TaxID=2724901 RepID=UPI0019155500|nr:hypothetical protein [Nitratiruptor sp. YY09-18]BCD67877.1 heat-inducible transcriptional repressor [Nitratiruptor sp. YY09-18]